MVSVPHDEMLHRVFRGTATCALYVSCCGPVLLLRKDCPTDGEMQNPIIRLKYYPNSINVIPTCNNFFDKNLKVISIEFYENSSILRESQMAAETLRSGVL